MSGHFNFCSEMSSLEIAFTSSALAGGLDLWQVGLNLQQGSLDLWQVGKIIKVALTKVNAISKEDISEKK